ncbi:hypothetical protein HDU76_011343 [Blyttiomyces sp. JEL0837]|nr:hypothetical protein HDU76_011343 [Blyttiomyces sp. JEL0837]
MTLIQQRGLIHYIILSLLTLTALLSTSSTSFQVQALVPKDESNYGNFHRSPQMFKEKMKERLRNMGGFRGTPGAGTPASGTPVSAAVTAASTAAAVPGGEKDDLYYFFSLHDYNHDGHLDGHELRVAFTEFETQIDDARGGRPDGEGKYAKDRLPMKELEELIDHALEEDDLDNDGMVSWAEYLQSQKGHRQME